MTWHDSNDDYLGALMSPKEETDYFYEVCDRVISNPRFYLDNLDKLYVFRIRKNSMIIKNRKLYK